MSLRVAFQGERGAYSHLAAQALLGPNVEVLPCVSFDEVFDTVASGAAERGVVPVENSLAGTIHRVYDLMIRHSLHIVGEHALRIAHSLIAAPGVALEDVRVVLSHPQALAQCEHRLRALGLKSEVAYDTAGAVKLLAESGRRDAAALASPLAAEVYGMQVLREELQDHEHNYTRFAVLNREALTERPSGDLKISVALSLHNEPGALFKALAVFALRNLDLTKIESRPLPGRTWEYLFYIDFVSDDFANKGRRALGHLEEICGMLKVLGVYPRRV
ncbi:MAG: prephenate dehydratase [Proteobacteria bacterium]|nr:prephenate dehydratase [Pseudomonadota bacterium]